MIEFLRHVAMLVRPYRLRLALGIVTGVICGLLEPLMIFTISFVFRGLFPSAGDSALSDRLADFQSKAPAFVRQALESIASVFPSPQAAVHLPSLVLFVGMIPAVILLRGVFGYLNVYLLQWTAVRAVADLRSRLFAHLTQMPAAFFNQHSTGELMSRVSSDTAALQGTVSSTLQVLIKDPVTLAGLLGYLLWTQPALTLISLVVFPVCIVPIVIYSRKVRHSTAAMQTHTAALSKQMLESFTGNRIIKAYNLEQRIITLFRETTDKFISHYMRVVRAAETPGPLLEFFGSIGLALVFIYLAYRTGGRANASDFLAVIISIFSMYKPIKSLARLHSQLEQARSASRRVFELLATRTTLLEPAQPKPLRAGGADIEFDHVDFNYGEKPVLRDIHLTVKAGQLVALVGQTGSGKTTLGHLLLRFYDPQRGAIRIGGIDLREAATTDLRAQIAVVTQETILFNDTIRRNIALGRDGATDAEVEEAARHAHAHEFILDKPQSYEARIGEKGVLLSGGQRQRLAIARAILKNAPILLLDEATSSLDSEVERAVQEALEELMVGRTTICIAHRLSTIQKADLIVVLDQGRIVERGTHAELVQRGGAYQKLYELQFQT